MNIETNNPLIGEILLEWRDRIGEDYDGYHGHVYCMYNFCLALLHDCSDEEKKKIAVATCHHDIGLWSDHTVDYIEPSISQAKLYLSQQELSEWSKEIVLMIEFHHKVRTYNDKRYPLVEVFRKGDLVDFSLGVFKCGVPKTYIKSVMRTIPNAGFHKFLMKGAKEWFAKHPFSPPPFMKW
jgi:hypothetical protein